MAAFIVLPLMALWELLTDTNLLMKWLVTLGIVGAAAGMGLGFIRSRERGESMDGDAGGGRKMV